MKFKHIIASALALATVPFFANAQGRVTVDFAKQGAEVPRSLYGVFFEEISHAGDGGLYAEMVQNRGFEDGNLPSGTTMIDGMACAPLLPCYSNDSINAFKVDGRRLNAMNAWSVECVDGSKPVYVVTTDFPLNAANTHNIKISAGQSKAAVKLINSGYLNGMAVKAGAAYDLEFYLRTKGYKGKTVEVSLVDKQGNAVATQSVKVSKDDIWTRYTTTLTPDQTASQLKLVLAFEPKGDIYADYISLFPRDTFKGRKNGLRKDVGELLADMKPDFMRWPGGCIVEGLTLENAVKWKETIGDPVTRPGEYNLWGYRSTYGFGYHEFLQLCEDMGSEAMFVCNAGMACLFRNGDYASPAKLDSLIQDAIDAIEYAIGGTDTRWGAERARNGHPEPFPLQYVEIGNENVGVRYAAHYNKFYKAIKAKYPQLTLISALMFNMGAETLLDEVEMIDPHYYETADWFYNNAYLYDKLPSDLPYTLYIGEYAATGRTSIYSSLAETAFLTGVERNGDKVKLVSYAPLFQASLRGGGHLIILNNEMVYGRSNYYMLREMAANRPDYNLETSIDEKGLITPFAPEGMIGVGTGGTVSQYKDFKVVKDGKTLYQTDWSDLATRWNASGGEWTVKDGVLTQGKLDGDHILWLKNFTAGDCDITFKARKVNGREGFRVMFGATDDKHYFSCEMGGYTNESMLFREVDGNNSVSLYDFRTQISVLKDRWYDVCIKIRGNHWQCIMDGKVQYEYDYFKNIKHYAVAGYDAAAGEVVIKLVNGENAPWTASIDLKNAASVASTGSIIEIAADSPSVENSFAEPLKVVPTERKLTGIKPQFDYNAPANSLTIIRIPAKR